MRLNEIPSFFPFFFPKAKTVTSQFNYINLWLCSFHSSLTILTAPYEFENLIFVTGMP